MQKRPFIIDCDTGTDDAIAIIAALLAAGKQVCVPRIEEGRMLAVPYANINLTWFLKMF